MSLFNILSYYAKSLFSKRQTDSNVLCHGWQMDVEIDDLGELKGGSEFSEVLKFSNCVNVVVKNGIVHAGREDCLDCVQGKNYIFENLKFICDGNEQAATLKGGIDGIIFKNCAFEGDCVNPYVVLGQYSNYNKIQDLVTRNITFDNCKFPKGKYSVITWRAENINVVNCENFTMLKIPYWIVWTYFKIRKIMQYNGMA